MSRLVAISGYSGSGKSLIANLLKKELGNSVNVLPLDAYYRDLSHLDSKEREKINFDHPKSFDWELLKHHMHRILEGKSIERPVYDFSKHIRLSKTIGVEPRPFIILEGLYAYGYEIKDGLFNMKVFVSADSDICVLRRIERDLTYRDRSFLSIKQQYIDHVKPMQEKYVEPLKEKADKVLGNNFSSIIPLKQAVKTLAQELGVQHRGGGTCR